MRITFSKPLLAVCAIIPTVDLNTETAEEIRQVAESGDFASLRQITVERVTLGAAVELACLRADSPSNSQISHLLDNWAESLPVLSVAFRTILTAAVPPRIDSYTARPFEFFPVTKVNWENNDHHLFEGRFDKGLKSCGFGGVSKAFVGAFKEMADNVVQHSGRINQKHWRSVIGYHVSDGCMAYAVGDVGIGVLSSLRQNPDWANLQNSEDALFAIITKGASRRYMGGEGGGFKQLLKSLVDANGLITLRSGDGYMTIQPDSGRRITKSRSAVPFVGLQLSVTCGIKKYFGEKMIEST